MKMLKLNLTNNNVELEDLFGDETDLDTILNNLPKAIWRLYKINRAVSSIDKTKISGMKNFRDLSLNLPNDALTKAIIRILKLMNLAEVNIGLLTSTGNKIHQEISKIPGMGILNTIISKMSEIIVFNDDEIGEDEDEDEDDNNGYNYDDDDDDTEDNDDDDVW